jgi:hypothetical protein
MSLLEQVAGFFAMLLVIAWSPKEGPRVSRGDARSNFIAEVPT